MVCEIFYEKIWLFPVISTQVCALVHNDNILLNAELRLPFIGNVQMVVCQGGDTAAPGSPGQEAQLHQVRLIHILQGHGLLANGGSQGFQAHRAAGIILNDGGEHPMVKF